MVMASDSDAPVEAWEGTFSEAYMEPASRDRRPEVIDPRGDGFFYWKTAGRTEPTPPRPPRAKRRWHRLQYRQPQP